MKTPIQNTQASKIDAPEPELIQRFLDGTTPSTEYLSKVSALIDKACAAEAAVPIDKLEEYADATRLRVREV